jgi:hypothetical protein
MCRGILRSDRAIAGQCKIKNPVDPLLDKRQLKCVGFLQLIRGTARKSEINQGSKMMNLFWTTITLLVVGIMGTMYFRQADSLRGQSADSAEFHEGQIFPTMVLPSLDGNRPGSVADFRGKKLLLHIFASW